MVAPLKELVERIAINWIIQKFNFKRLRRKDVSTLLKTATWLVQRVSRVFFYTFIIIKRNKTVCLIKNKRKKCQQCQTPHTIQALAVIINVKVLSVPKKSHLFDRLVLKNMLF